MHIQIAPSESGIDVGAYMNAAERVQAQILLETIESAENGALMESGRTICPGGSSLLRGPLSRFPRAVDLQSCPAGGTGIMHTHVSVEQLRSPTHSIPDIANVVFEDIAASMVVGTRESEVMVSPDDPEAARELFQDALGQRVSSTRDVIAVLDSGEVVDYADLRARIKSRLDPLFTTVPSNFSDLDARVSQMGTQGGIPARGHRVATCMTHQWGSHHDEAQSQLASACQKVRSKSKHNEEAIRSLAETAAPNNIAQFVVASAAGGIISTLANRMFFGD